MEITLLSLAQYESLVKMIEELKSLIENSDSSNKDKFLDNQEFLQLMNISKRTAQAWRDEGIISFSQVGHKIYYRMGDITKMMEANFKPGFKNLRNKKGGSHVR